MVYKRKGKYKTKNPRDMKILLQIALDNIEEQFSNKVHKCSGLCSYMWRLTIMGIISIEERTRLEAYIDNHIEPYSFWGRIFRRAYTKQYKHRYHFLYIVKDSSYWFSMGKVKPRIRYLKYLLKKCR